MILADSCVLISKQIQFSFERRSWVRLHEHHLCLHVAEKRLPSGVTHHENIPLHIETTKVHISLHIQFTLNTGTDVVASLETREPKFGVFVIFLHHVRPPTPKSAPSRTCYKFNFCEINASIFN